MESEQPLADWVGLDVDEAALYRAMLRAGGPARPERLAAELERTVPDVRSGVERLADLGFLTERGPVAPSLALRAVLHRRLAGLHEQQSALEAAAAQVDRLAAGFLAAEPGSLPVEGIELVVGREEVARRAGDMVATARSEMLVLDAPPYAQVAPPAPDQPCEPFTSAAASDVGQAIARGVKIRRVVAQEALDLPGRMAAISELVELGLSVRVSQVVPTKMMVADGRTALIPPSPTADPSSQAIVVHDGLLLNVLGPFFEAVWEAAMPLGGAADAPSEADRALLALLAGGLKDEAIARQLDVHVHTARRRISALLARLGVTTRFQAGMQAARRGWLAELSARVGSLRSRRGSPAARVRPRSFGPLAAGREGRAGMACAQFSGTRSNESRAFPTAPKGPQKSRYGRGVTFRDDGHHAVCGGVRPCRKVRLRRAACRRSQRDPSHHPRSTLSRLLGTLHSLGLSVGRGEPTCGVTTPGTSCGAPSTPSRGPECCSSSRPAPSCRSCSAHGSAAASAARTRP